MRPIETSLANDIEKAIRNFAPVVGLDYGPADLIDSLNRLETILFRASRSSHPALAEASGRALAAVKARESVNGTNWEKQNPQGFAALTDEACSALKNLYNLVTPTIDLRATSFGEPGSN